MLLTTTNNVSGGFDLKVFMKRNFLPHFFIALKDQLKSQYNFFNRIFVTALLFEIFNFIWFKNNTTSDVIVHNHLSKKLQSNFIG